MVDEMDYFASSDTECEQKSGIFETSRMETDTMPPLVDLGRKLQAKAKDGDTEGVKELMGQGAPFTTDWLGLSPLHLACQNNHYSTAELLIKAGISRDARNKVDRTPLHITAQEGHVKILKLLLLHGVDVDATDMLLMTPLHWASEYGHKECVRILLEAGADPFAINKFDKTADQIAFDNNYLEITAMIQDYAEDPMLSNRRKLAKERLKAANSKTAADIEKNIRDTGEFKEIRLLKLPRKKMQPNVILENHEKPVNSVQTNQIKQEIEQNSSINQANPITSNFNPAKNINESTEKTLAMLQEHGITMLPNDESTIVASAVESGQKVVLTEAGKMALNLTEKQMQGVKAKELVKIPLLDSLKGKKVIHIKPEQLINMKNERKVIIQTDKKLKPSIFQNSAQQLGVPLVQVHPLPQSQPLGKVQPIVRTQPLVPTKTLVKKQPLLQSRVQPKPKLEVLVTKKIVCNQIQLSSTIVEKLPEKEEEVAEVDTRQELDELKKQLHAITQKYLQKEKEAQEYKKLVEILMKSK